MKTALWYDTEVNAGNQTIIINRSFFASVERVWKAWTTPEIIHQWMAPRPMVVHTRTMDFREAGYWHFALVSPGGREHWCRYDYQEIQLQKKITELRASSDENGIVLPDFPRTQCINVFQQTGSKTLVTITARYQSEELFRMMSSQEHRKGFTSTLVQLDRLLMSL